MRIWNARTYVLRNLKHTLWRPTRQRDNEPCEFDYEYVCMRIFICLHVCSYCNSYLSCGWRA